MTLIITLIRESSDGRNRERVCLLEVIMKAIRKSVSLTEHTLRCIHMA